MSTIPRQALILPVFSLANATEASRNAVGQESSRENLLELNFEQFDQDMEGGWRVFADNKKYGEAARMIEAYLECRSDLTPANKRILHFHAGQMWAMGERKTLAIEHFEKSTQPRDNDFMRWNAYVEGTIAFLKQDMAKLRASREQVSQAGLPASSNKNLVVLDMLLASPSSSYRKIFEDLIEKNKKSARKSADG